MIKKTAQAAIKAMDERIEYAINRVLALCGHSLTDFGYVRDGDEEKNARAIIDGLNVAASLYQPVAPQAPLGLSRTQDHL